MTRSRALKAALHSRYTVKRRFAELHERKNSWESLHDVLHRVNKIRRDTVALLLRSLSLFVYAGKYANQCYTIEIAAGNSRDSNRNVERDNLEASMTGFRVRSSQIFARYYRKWSALSTSR